MEQQGLLRHLRICGEVVGCPVVFPEDPQLRSLEQESCSRMPCLELGQEKVRSQQDFGTMSNRGTTVASDSPTKSSSI